MHVITRSKVQGARVSTLRARCSCNEFQHDVPRLSTPGRRKLDRLVREHLTSVVGAASAADMLTAVAIEGSL